MADLTTSDTDAFGTLEDTWYASFLIHHRDTVGKVEGLSMEDPKLMGPLPFRPSDLERVIRRTEEMQAWFQQFETGSGNPIRVMGIVGSWPDGDRQSRPRLVTAYCPLLNSPEANRQWTQTLMSQFGEAPTKAPILKGDLWSLLVSEGKPLRPARKRCRKTQNPAAPNLPA